MVGGPHRKVNYGTCYWQGEGLWEVLFAQPSDVPVLKLSFNFINLVALQSRLLRWQENDRTSSSTRNNNMEWWRPWTVLVKQDGYNSPSYILSDLLALWIHTVRWAFIFPVKVALFNAVSSFFTDKHCALPGGNCTIHRINTQSYIQEWIMVCVLHHRLLQVSADILSSDEGWEIKRVCQFPLVIWGCALRRLWQTNALH